MDFQREKNSIVGLQNKIIDAIWLRNKKKIKLEKETIPI
jgi:hypothetical protein